MTNRIGEFEQRLQDDSSSQEIKEKWLVEHSRIEGAQVYREILADWVQWNQCSHTFQDLVIERIEQQLGAAFAWVETRLYSCQQVSHRIATFRHIATDIELNLIPGDQYVRGSQDLSAELDFIQRFYPTRDMDFFELEKPRSMTVDPMLIGRFPVTYAQWGKVRRKRKGQEWGGPSFPVENVSWEQTQTWLAKVGDGLRLPWEREWEYACRAGTETRFFWGQDMDAAYCWDRSSSDGQTHQVTEHENNPNAFGLVDMLGNVSEWCQDKYQDWETWYADEYRIVRGGNVSQDAAFCRCANVGMARSGNGYAHVGFRVALTLPEMC